MTSPASDTARLREYKAGRTRQYDRLAEGNCSEKYIKQVLYCTQTAVKCTSVKSASVKSNCHNFTKSKFDSSETKCDTPTMEPAETNAPKVTPKANPTPEELERQEREEREKVIRDKKWSWKRRRKRRS